MTNSRINSHNSHIQNITLRKNPTRSKNSTQFAEESKTPDISNSDVKVSYDVVNLYPTVPTKEAATTILGMPAQDEILQTKTNPTIERKLTT